MASPNLDLVRSIFTAWERWEWRSFEWADPEQRVIVLSHYDSPRICPTYRATARTAPIVPG